MPAHDVSTAEAVVIEADTAEEALALVRERLGDDAEVLEARKVQRGGWKGFFALERVELTARARGASRDTGVVAQDPRAPSGDDRLVEAAPTRRFLEDEEAKDRADFDRMLRRLLESEPAAATTAPPSATTSPAAATAPPSAMTEVADHQPGTWLAEDADRGNDLDDPQSSALPREPVRDRTTPADGGVAWSCRALEGLRLPTGVIDACRGLEPADDAAWVTAIADVVGPWCRSLPSGAPAYVGPRLGRFARAHAIPVVRLGADDAPYGPIALETPDTCEGRVWAARLAGDRWLHVVVGGRRWHGFVFEDALAVSWSGDDQLPWALSLASRLGLVLGHGHRGGAAPLVRATPVDVALTIRALLPRA